MRNNRQKITLIIGALCIAFACIHQKENVSSSSESQLHPDFLKTVETAKAVLNTHEEELTLTGKVEYDPDKVIHYVPLISGIVERTYFSLGDQVRKGQPLFDIRSADLSALEAEATMAEAEVGIARRERQKAQSMYEDRMLSERELLEAESKLKQAEAVCRRVKNDMTNYLPKEDGVFSIVSPANGFIVAKNGSSGTPVSPENGALFTVADLSEVWVIAHVYASNVQFVNKGMAVHITTLSYPDEVFTGEIHTVSQVFDPEDKTLKARIKMKNQHRKLKPEMSVVIKLKSESPNRLITIPSDAVIFDNDTYFVIVETASEQFLIREVEPAGTHHQNTYIRTGLDEGETVVTKNQLLIYSGLKQSE